MAKRKVSKEFLLAFLRRWKDASHAGDGGEPTFWTPQDQEAYERIRAYIKAARAAKEGK